MKQKYRNGRKVASIHEAICDVLDGKNFILYIAGHRKFYHNLFIKNMQFRTVIALFSRAICVGGCYIAERKTIEVPQAIGRKPYRCPDYIKQKEKNS